MRRGHRHGGATGGGGGGGGSAGGGFRQHGAQPLNRNHVFDSQGPDLRVRGTAQQLFEKYLQLGRDATSGGDRVAAEGYFQHAEHYFRILGAMNVAQQGGGGPGQPQPPQRPRYNGPEGLGEADQYAEGDDRTETPIAEYNGLAAELAAETEALTPLPGQSEPREG
jgi:hypothetical protein